MLSSFSSLVMLIPSSCSREAKISQVELGTETLNKGAEISCRSNHQDIADMNATRLPDLCVMKRHGSDFAGENCSLTIFPLRFKYQDLAAWARPQRAL